MNSIARIVKNTRILAEDIIFCKKLNQKIKGLMFRRKLDSNQAMVFENKKESINDSTIHMLFVFFSIDVVWLNKNLEIVDLREHVLPFTPVIMPKDKAKYIIEFPNGKIKEAGLEEGDKLKFL